jgi:hypothetical protein
MAYLTRVVEGWGRLLSYAASKPRMRVAVCLTLSFSSMLILSKYGCVCPHLLCFFRYGAKR